MVSNGHAVARTSLPATHLVIMLLLDSLKCEVHECASAFLCLDAPGAQYKDQAAGSGGLVVLGDAFAYDSQAKAWVEVQLAPGSAPLPAARNAASLLPLRGDAGFVLHGGWVPFVSTFHDTYVLRVKA